MKKGISKLIYVLTGGIIGGVIGGSTVRKQMNKKIKERQEMSEKVSDYYHIFEQWLSVRQDGKSLDTYFKRNGYKTIAIYGMKELGERLYDELKDSGIEVKYVIDKNADAIYIDVDVFTPDDELAPVDVIVVTATFYYDEIEEMLRGKVDYPVVSLEEVLYEM